VEPSHIFQNALRFTVRSRGRSDSHRRVPDCVCLGDDQHGRGLVADGIEDSFPDKNFRNEFRNQSRRRGFHEHPVCRLLYTCRCVGVGLGNGDFDRNQNLSPLPGTWIALQIFETEEAISLSSYIAPACNFLALNIAVGGLASLIATCSDRRSIAIGGIVAFLLFSMVLNFVEPFIKNLSAISFVGVMHYFRPVDVVRANEWPVGNIAVLLSAGVVCWIASLIVFSRRDIPIA